jgi:hypothetical protein
MATASKTTRAKKPTSSPALPPAPAAPTGKLGDLVTLLSGVDGATIAQLTAKTGWQVHSVRGAMAGALKKRGYIITSLKTDGVRVYRTEELKR